MFDVPSMEGLDLSGQRMATGASSRFRGQRPADSCGTTKTGLNDQAVERGDDKDIETT